LYLKNYLNVNRVGIVVKKKYGNAVFRNYEKRIIREFFRTSKSYFTDFYDLIIILHKKSDSYFEKKKDYIDLISKIEKNEKK